MASAHYHAGTNDIPLGPYERQNSHVQDQTHYGFDNDTWPSYQEHKGSYPTATFLTADSHEQSPRGTAEKRRTTWPVFKWSWEVIALLLSIGCQAALIVILRRMSDRPLYEWTAMISLNAMISIITLCSRFLLLFPVEAAISQLKWLHLRRPQRTLDFELFDQATRGPIGALQLLVRRPLHMASAGCLVIIFASVMAPFIQQTVSYETRAVSSGNSSASFGYAYEYNTGGLNGYAGTGINPTEVDFTLRGAVIKGLYNFSLTPEFNCPGTCEWNETWTTLGFAHECRDVTEESLSNRRCWTFTYSEEVEPWSEDAKLLNWVCNFTTPGNVTLRHTYAATDWQDTMNVSSINHVGDSVKPVSTDPMFLTTAQYRVNDWLSNQSVPIVENVTECDFSVTAWKMAGASSTGQSFLSINQTRIPLDSQPYVPQDDTTGQTTQVAIWNQTDLPEDFKLGTWDWMNVASMMADTFNMTVRVGDYGLTDWLQASPMAVGTTSGVDLNDVAARVTSALTDAVRSGPGKQLLYGNSVDQVIFVNVRWLWYIVPIVAEAAAIILVAFMMWSAHRNIETPLWKNSSLAPLFHEIQLADDAPGSYVLRPRVVDVQDLAHRAKKSLISFDSGKGSIQAV